MSSSMAGTVKLAIYLHSGYSFLLQKTIIAPIVRIKAIGVRCAVRFQDQYNRFF